MAVWEIGPAGHSLLAVRNNRYVVVDKIESIVWLGPKETGIRMDSGEYYVADQSIVFVSDGIAGRWEENA
jgi:hypothetical protein